MGDIIPFKPKENDTVALRMMRVADEIDEVILKHLSEGMNHRDLCGLLAHRLGSLIKVGEGSAEVLAVCLSVTAQQVAGE